MTATDLPARIRAAIDERERKVGLQLAEYSGEGPERALLEAILRGCESERATVDLHADPAHKCGSAWPCLHLRTIAERYGVEVEG